MARMNIGKAENGRYRVLFEADSGKVVCEVADQLGRQTENEKKQAALKKAKMLAKAFYEAIPER